MKAKTSRDRFEAWFRRAWFRKGWTEGDLMHDDFGGYHGTWVDGLWVGWQAGRRQRK